MFALLKPTATCTCRINALLGSDYYIHSLQQNNFYRFTKFSPQHLADFAPITRNRRYIILSVTVAQLITLIWIKCDVRTILKWSPEFQSLRLKLNSCSIRNINAAILINWKFNYTNNSHITIHNGRTKLCLRLIPKLFMAKLRH